MEENTEKLIDQGESSNIIERHFKDGKYNLTTAFLELDKRVSMLETAMGYLAELERRKMGIQDKIEGLILPEEPRIIKPGEL